MPFRHKNIRLNSPYYMGQRSYFVTFCCEGRRPVFADPGNAAWLIEKLREQAVAFGFAIYAYCVMPDHFHILVNGLEPASDLLSFVKNLKQTTAHEYLVRHDGAFGAGAKTETDSARLNRKAAATQASANRGALWQKKFYDHILRERDSFDGVAGYIWMNPVRQGLCADSRDYAHSGSFVIDWKKIMRPLESWVPKWKAKSTSPVEKTAAT
jgi:putative transposase